MGARLARVPGVITSLGLLRFGFFPHRKGATLDDFIEYLWRLKELIRVQSLEQGLPPPAAGHIVSL